MWTRWEHVFESDRDYVNPCTDVEVRVQFVGPAGETFSGLCFWDGGHKMVMRATFPVSGMWSWASSCSDTDNAGLHGKTGSVDVSDAVRDGLFSRHGYLRASSDGKLLTHADGTPFLWIGDTCWAAPVHATPSEWDTYTANRAEKGYSVLQMSIAPEWALDHARLGLSPFLSQLPDITKLNPEFFQQMDRKLALANDLGLAVLLVGLMETPFRYPSPEQTAVLSRYVSARYASYAIVLSPSFDSCIHEPETLASADAIRLAAPNLPVTMHMGTGVGPHFHGADWLSFDMYQSGHNGGDAARQSARAIGMPAELLALTPRKPIINGEAIYEGDLGGAYGVRRTAWLSMLSGAVGFTAGIDELYLWDEDAVEKMNLPSSDQVALCAAILRAIPWHRLEPAYHRILNQPQDRARLMAAAFTPDKSLGLAYLPDNEILHLSLSDTGPLESLWVNAATGEVVEGGPCVASADTSFRAPDPRDWVLILAAPDSGLLAAVRNAARLHRAKREVNTASIRFALDAPCDGLVRKSPGDGLFTRTTWEGAACVVNEKPARNRYLYLDVDDRLAFRGNVPSMTVEIRLQSAGALDNIGLQYDAPGPGEIANIYRPSSAPSRATQDGWTVVRFRVDSPYLGNRQNSGADFRIDLGREKYYVAEVRVELERWNDLPVGSASE